MALASGATTLDRVEVSGVAIEEVVVEAGESLPWHDHPSMYIDFWMKGRMEGSWIDSTACHTLSLLPAGFKHRSSSLSQVRTLQLIVPESEVRRLEQEISPCRAPTVFESSYPVHIAFRLFQAFKFRDDLCAFDLETHLADLWHAATRSESRSADAKAPWIRHLEEILRASYSRPQSPQKIAAQVGIDRSHMMREYRRVHRQTLGGFVRSLRVEEACRLMRSSELSFAEIAHKVGFADQSHMNRTLRQTLGVSPRDYVRSTRQ